MKDLSLFISELRQHLNRLFAAYDKVWLSRRRKLDSKHMFSAIFAQVLGKDSTNARLIAGHIETLAETAFSDFSASSFSKARRRFPFEFFVDLCQWIYKFHEVPEAKKWFGYSFFALDSTKFTVPKELEGDGFDSMNDCDSYYPQAMLTAMFDLQLGMIYDSIVSQHNDERANAIQLFPGLPKNSVVICDRGFPSFDLMYEAEKAGVKLLMRIGKDMAPEELADFIESDRDEEVIVLTPSLPSERKALRHGHNPIPIEVRAIKYLIKDSLFIVITTMMDSEVSKEDLARLYWTRWDIEEQFKLSKIGLKLEDFKAKHIHGVLQEVWATQALTAICRSLAICTKGPKEKRNIQKDHSTLGIAKLLKPSLLRMLFCSKHALIALTERLRKGLERTLVKNRPGRTFERKSKGRLCRWSANADGVSC